MSEITGNTYNEKSKKYIQTFRTNHKETYLNYVRQYNKTLNERKREEIKEKKLKHYHWKKAFLNEAKIFSEILSN